MFQNKKKFYAVRRELEESMETKGCIYILTNPSFENYVKIGYADNIDERLKQLNRSECTPFAFRVYATYEVSTRLSDKKLHSIIDKLNPNLRAIDDVEGKKRVREFYAMTAEEAYSLLEAIAEINGLTDKLKKKEPTKKELQNEELEKTIRQEAFRFSLCDIPVGSELEFCDDRNIKCYVSTNRKVIFENEELSLSALAKKLLGVSYSVTGPHYFLYKGEYLYKLRKEI